MKMLKQKLGKLYGTYYLNNNNGTEKKTGSKKTEAYKNMIKRTRKMERKSVKWEEIFEC